MAREIDLTTADGLTLYLTVQRLSDGMYWTGSAFEALTTAHWPQYAQALTKMVIAAGAQANYSASFPAVSAGPYRVEIYKQAGGSPSASADGQPFKGGIITWTGTAELVPAITSNGQPIQLTSDGHVEATDEIGGSLATPLSTTVNQTAASAIAAAVWNALLSGLTTANSIGKKLAGLILGTDNKVLISADAQTVTINNTGQTTPLPTQGGNVFITPLQASVANPRYALRDLAPMAQGSSPLDAWTVIDGAGNPINLSGKTLRMVIASIDVEHGEHEQCDPFDDTFIAFAKYETDGQGITIGGAGNNIVSVQQSSVSTAGAGRFYYWLLNVTDLLPIAAGAYPVKPTLWDT